MNFAEKEALTFHDSPKNMLSITNACVANDATIEQRISGRRPTFSTKKTGTNVKGRRKIPVIKEPRSALGISHLPKSWSTKVLYARRHLQPVKM